MKSNSPVRRPSPKPRLKAELRSNGKPQRKTASRAKTDSLKLDPPATLSVPEKVSWAGRVPQVNPGVYDDGLPLHQVEYLACKMMLKPNHFDSRNSLFDFADIVEKAAKETGVRFTTKGYSKKPLKLREVLFVDTKDFRLYNNAFILRRRIPYEDGFPVGDPEVVFKFRHPDIQAAAETDVRPQILGKHRVKFKCQVLPLKEKLGGIRLLYSHNVQFPRS
ncbi:MAG: hypothetical protein ACJ72Z_01815, partial [Pyrinomonadaceae bacterium]